MAMPGGTGFSAPSTGISFNKMANGRPRQDLGAAVHVGRETTRLGDVLGVVVSERARDVLVDKHDGGERDDGDEGDGERHFRPPVPNMCTVEHMYGTCQ